MGVITQEEFEKKKAELLRMPEAFPAPQPASPAEPVPVNSFPAAAPAVDLFKANKSGKKVNKKNTVLIAGIAAGVLIIASCCPFICMRSLYTVKGRFSLFRTLSQTIINSNKENAKI